MVGRGSWARNSPRPGAVHLDAILLVLWHIWKARNALIFDKQRRLGTKEVIHRVQVDMSSWTCRFKKTSQLWVAWRDYLASCVCALFCCSPPLVSLVRYAGLNLCKVPYLFDNIVLLQPNAHSMCTRGKAGIAQPVDRIHVVPMSPLPCSVRDALSDPNWRCTMQVEYDALIANDTWSLVPHPPGVNIVTGKWIYRHKLLTWADHVPIFTYRSCCVHGCRLGWMS
jgi:hypothetical protein